MVPAVTAFRAVLRREWADVCVSPLAQAQLLWLPLASIVLVWAVFMRGTATDLPVVLVDQDHTALSRQLGRTLDAMPGLAVRGHADSLEAGRSAIRRGDAEGLVLVPADFSRRLKRGEPGEITAWFNAQYLLTGNLVSRELQTAVLTFSAQVEARGRLARGTPKVAVAIHTTPVAARRDTLNNPYLNYVPFLVAGLAAGIVQMFAMLGAVRVTGREYRDGTALVWLATAGQRIIPAVAAKLVLPTLACVVMETAFLAGLHGWLGWPMRGNWTVLLLAVVLLVLAYEGLGLLVMGLTANYRLASSVTAFFTAPALAFAGLTFPLGSMPPLAEAWGQSLPLSWFLRLQIEQAVRGAPAIASGPELALLAGATVLTLSLALPLLSWRARQPQSMGKT